jgi:5-hydroxyisourate hydrolase-like protein (transthyretin family)
MGPATRYTFAVMFLLCCALTPVCVRAQTTTKKSLRSSISGKVTIKGKPASGIIVGARQADMSNSFQPTYKATTDQDGNYRILNVPAGNYEVLSASPVFVNAEINNQRGKYLVLAEGENVENINFSLVRGGVITGKIIDADGRPVIQQQVSLYRAGAFEQSSAQRGQIYPTTSVSTDDRGIYRMFGIVAGRYKVAAGRGDNTFSGSLAVGRASYQQVFHPDVSDQAKATVIEVSEGSEATNVDVTLGRLQQTFKASGQVIDGEKGLPMPNFRFGLQRIKGDRPEFMNSLMASNSQGAFIVEGLVPGKYSAFLFPEPNNEARVDAVAFDIVDQDVSGLVIKVVRGASLSGNVLLDGEDKNAFSKLLELQVQAYVSNPQRRPSFGQSGPIGPDGSFHLGGLEAGTANFSLDGPGDRNQSKGFTISRVERDGLVLPRGFEIKEGEQVTGLRVIVSYGNATLRGVVAFENGPLPAGGGIIVRVQKPGETGSNLQISVDARGHFIIEGLPGGLYELTVIVSLPGAKQRPPVKQQVSLQDGVVTDVTVSVDLGPIVGSNSP